MRLRDIGDMRPIVDTPALATLKPHRTWTRLAWIAAAIGICSGAILAWVHFREVPPETQLVRVTVPLPQDAVLISHAISPDGRRLAFTARDPNGRTYLWVRSLDTLGSQKMTETEGASYPFWSPDSDYIGYFTETQLKKIRASGSPPQVICDVRIGRGGSWSPGGTILFAQANSAVFRVSSAGGQPKSVTKLDSALKDAAHYWPHLLPGSLRFLFTRISSRPDVRGIWVASLNEPQDARRLTADQSEAAFASGHLLFVRDGALIARPFDAARSELTGESVPIADKVTSSVGSATAKAGFSVSQNGVLVLGTGVSNAELSRLTWFDRSGRRLGSIGPPGQYLRVALSPSQANVAVDMPDSNRALDIFVVDPLRGISKRLTFDPAFDTGPVWSPDGSRIVFASNRGGVYDLYQRQAGGGGKEERLLQSEQNKYATDWSRDGRYILYVEPDSRLIDGIWVISMNDGRKPVPYLRGDFHQSGGRFSPDGRWVAYISTESGSNELYVQSFPLGSAKYQISTGRASRLVWRPDGKELYYVAGDLKLMAVEVKTGASFAAGLPKALFETHLANSHVAFDVSADGQRFLMPVPVETTGSEPVTMVLNWTAGIRK